MKFEDLMWGCRYGHLLNAPTIVRDSKDRMIKFTLKPLEFDVYADLIIEYDSEKLIKISDDDEEIVVLKYNKNGSHEYIGVSYYEDATIEFYDNGNIRKITCPYVNDYEFDINGNVTRVEDLIIKYDDNNMIDYIEVSEESRFRYDNKGRIISYEYINHKDFKIEYFGYDDYDNLIYIKEIYNNNDWEEQYLDNIFGHPVDIKFSEMFKTNYIQKHGEQIWILFYGDYDKE